ncbi:MAG TPA: hypothetical protein VGP22_03085 [Albitalea sp.]|jgi:alkylation response protein AidB-like acyl-CoA dehydrogenase|nr:hypothetical protein [Albitalea sp.]
MTTDTTARARSPLATALSEALRDAPPVHAGGGLSRDWWRHLGACGVLAPGFDADGGVPAADGSALSALAGLIARDSASLGAASAWLSNQLIGGFVLAPHARSDAQRALLCAMSRGEALVAMAFCEAAPDAQPSCRATRDGDGWILDGQTGWVGHGAGADAFVVLATHGEAGGPCCVDAFVVRADAPALWREPAGWAPGTDAAAHCGLRLSGCRVEATERLGDDLGHAVDAIARPWRTIEDALRLGPMLGAMHAELDAIALWMRMVPPERRPTRTLGALRAELDALAPLAAHAAHHLDLHGPDERLAALSAGTHDAMAHWQSAFERFAAPLDDHPIALPGLVRDLRRMLAASGAGTEARQRRAGQRLDLPALAPA